MTIPRLREFIQQHMLGATGLAVVAAALDERAGGGALDPALAARIDELLGVLGARDVLDEIGPADAAPLLAELRFQLGFNAQLLYAHSRQSSWSYTDDALLLEVGKFARMHALALTRGVVPALADLGERLTARDAAFLDIGVGVAGTAIGMAEQWPNLRIVGIDVWQPSLRLARRTVAEAGLEGRIELREQGAERLEDDQAFDLAWMPLPFMPETILAEAGKRAHRALRPGGWLVCNLAHLGVPDERVRAMMRLRTTTWGGPLWVPERVEQFVREHGFVDVRILPGPPGSPVVNIAGRRASR